MVTVLKTNPQINAAPFRREIQCPTCEEMFVPTAHIKVVKLDLTVIATTQHEKCFAWVYVDPKEVLTWLLAGLTDRPEQHVQEAAQPQQTRPSQKEVAALQQHQPAAAQQAVARAAEAQPAPAQPKQNGGKLHVRQIPNPFAPVGGNRVSQAQLAMITRVCQEKGLEAQIEACSLWPMMNGKPLNEMSMVTGIAFIDYLKEEAQGF